MSPIFAQQNFELRSFLLFVSSFLSVVLCSTLHQHPIGYEARSDPLFTMSSPDPLVNKLASMATSPESIHEFAITAQVEEELLRAYRRHQPIAQNKLTASQSAFANNTFCCTICDRLLPPSSFYPSNLQRSAFYCKACCRRQVQALAQQRKLQALATQADNTSDRELVPSSSICAKATTPIPPKGQTQPGGDAFVAKKTAHMVNRLRRMCARPDKTGFRKLLPHPAGLGFGVRVARKLLAFWQHQSALSGDGPTDYSQLCLLPWNAHMLKQDQDLTPWDIIPVTRQECRRLCSIPRQLWQDCFQPGVYACVEAKLANLQRALQQVQLPLGNSSDSDDTPMTNL